MRTTLDLSEALVKEAMNLTRITNRSDLIKIALQNLIQQEKCRSLKEYYGKAYLDIDLDTTRDRYRRYL